ncbi:MAG TPA: hypothetical protein VH593_18990, partial [Ktedonobacteraceae bacterium]
FAVYLMSIYSTSRERKNFSDLAQIFGPTLAWERSSEKPCPTHPSTLLFSRGKVKSPVIDREHVQFLQLRMGGLCAAVARPHQTTAAAGDNDSA